MVNLPETEDELQSTTCRHLLYLQLRQDHIEGLYRADVSVQLSAASIAVHAEFGNHCSQIHDAGPYFLAQHYLPDNVRSVQKICQKHTEGFTKKTRNNFRIYSKYFYMN